MIYQFTPDKSNQLSERVFKMPIEGLYFVETPKHIDERGFYSEIGVIPEIEQVIGQKFSISQLNLSNSRERVIRGLHAENWNKLLTIVTGVGFCAWVDVRPDSAQFKDVVTMVLGEGEGVPSGSIFISAGIANSFLALEGPLNYLYAVDQVYAKRDKSGDVAISLFDQELNIPWPIERSQMILSDRDSQAKTLREFFNE